MIRKHEFIGYVGKSCEIVELDGNDGLFYYRSDEKEEDLPKVGAFCKYCAKETAKPIYPVFMNGKPAYALQCTKCRNEYVMYKHTYFTRYIGSTTKNGGRINPTRGMMSRFDAMDRKAREEYNSIPNRVEDELCNKFGCSHEEYKKMKSKWDEDNKKVLKKIKKRRGESPRSLPGRENENSIRKATNTHRKRCTTICQKHRTRKYRNGGSCEIMMMEKEFIRHLKNYKITSKWLKRKGEFVNEVTH